MSRNNVYGIACKTCRRRGRKCDRTLPTCKSCHLRNVSCEGYTLRWVNASGQGTLGGQISMDPNHEDAGWQLPHLALEKYSPRKPNRTGSREMSDSSLSDCQRVTASIQAPLNPYQVATRLKSPTAHDIQSRAISTLQRISSSIPMNIGLTRDDLGGFVNYCMPSNRPEGYGP